MFGFSEAPIEEETTALRHIVNGDGTNDLRYLRSLRDMARPTIDRIAGDVVRKLGLPCEVHAKTDSSALAKATRPSIVERSPWFTLAHVRDFLRFRTHLDEAADIERVCDLPTDYVRSGAVSVVKLDAAKMVRPGPFGWRMIAIDLRDTGSGLIVEHYMSFRDLILANEDWLHALYEHWRVRDPEDMTGRDGGRWSAIIA